MEDSLTGFPFSGTEKVYSTANFLFSLVAGADSLTGFLLSGMKKENSPASFLFSLPVKEHSLTEFLFSPAVFLFSSGGRACARTFLDISGHLGKSPLKPSEKSVY